MRHFLIATINDRNAPWWPHVKSDWHHSVKCFSTKCNKVIGFILIWWLWFIQSCSTLQSYFCRCYSPSILMSTDWYLSVKCLSTRVRLVRVYGSQICFTNKRSTHREKSQCVYFISSSYITGGERSFFLLQGESTYCKHLVSFSTFSCLSKSITGFFRRPEDLTSNKYIILWACKPTHAMTRTQPTLTSNSLESRATQVLMILVCYLLAMTLI